MPAEKEGGVMSAIIRMTRYGRNYVIMLDCGHAMTRTVEEVKLQQLCIEKQVGCVECAAEKAKGL